MQYIVTTTVNGTTVRGTQAADYDTCEQVRRQMQEVADRNGFKVTFTVEEVEEDCDLANDRLLHG